MGVVGDSSTNIYKDAIGRFDDGTFRSWGQPLTFTAIAIGGAIGNVMFVYFMICANLTLNRFEVVF